MNAQWQNPRGIRERIIVTGRLVLETPTHLGTGDAESPLDMPLLLDPLEGRTLLTGSSIAGALRHYLGQHAASLADELFGEVTAAGSRQSALIVDDALGNEPDVELRDGVAIDPKTRAAEAGRKFDIELLSAGTEFPLSFELLVPKGEDDDRLRRAFALALKGLENGRIRLGKRRRRGFGQCRVTEWTVRCYDMITPQGLADWLDGNPSGQREGTDIAVLLGVAVEGEDRRPMCILESTFALDGSLLIRSGSGAGDAPDTVHLHSKRNGRQLPVLSGTSLAGALRARALRIANTLGRDGYAITDQLFGYRSRKGDQKTPPTAGRVWVEETTIQNPLELVQSRIKIDRFTGGAYPGALFSEQPVFGREDTRVQVRVTLQNPQDKEVGLLLLLLKDLWTGDLPLGGESSVGRGRFTGERASLAYKGNSWSFTQQDDGTVRVEGDRARLERFVQSFVRG